MLYCSVKNLGNIMLNKEYKWSLNRLENIGLHLSYETVEGVEGWCSDIEISRKILCFVHTDALKPSKLLVLLFPPCATLALEKAFCHK